MKTSSISHNHFFNAHRAMLNLALGLALGASAFIVYTPQHCLASGNAAEEKAKAELEAKEAKEAAEAAEQKAKAAKDQEEKKLSEDKLAEVTKNAGESNTKQAMLRDGVKLDFDLNSVIKTGMDQARVNEFSDNENFQKAMGERIRAESVYDSGTPEKQAFLEQRAVLDVASGTNLAMEARSKAVPVGPIYNPNNAKSEQQTKYDFGKSIPSFVNGFEAHLAANREADKMSPADVKVFNAYGDQVKGALSTIYSRLDTYRQGILGSNIPPFVGLPTKPTEEMWGQFIDFDTAVQKSATVASTMTPNNRDTATGVARDKEVKQALDFHRKYWPDQPHPPAN